MNFHDICTKLKYIAASQIEYNTKTFALEYQTGCILEAAV